MATRKQKIIAPTHMTVMEFAKKKEVSRTVIYKHIKDKLIIPDLVGEQQQEMIDWSAYKDYVFSTPKWTAKSVAEKYLHDNPVDPRIKK